MGVTTATDGEISFITTSSASVPAGYYITSKATDPNNNTSEFSKCALLNAGRVDQAADLSITKSDDVYPVAAGSNVTYTITVTNNGPSTSTDVVVTDPLPSQTSFVSASSACVNNTGLAAVVCNLGDIGVERIICGSDYIESDGERVWDIDQRRQRALVRCRHDSVEQHRDSHSCD